MSDSSVISEQELCFYRKHPELLHSLGDKATIHRVLLLVVFIIGFLFVVVSKAMKFGLVGSEQPWLVELAVDLVFELGIALWGGVATTVLLQEFIKRQYRDGKRYQHAIMSRLAEEGSDNASAETPITGVEK